MEEANKVPNVTIGEQEAPEKKGRRNGSSQKKDKEAQRLYNKQYYRNKKKQL